jgi:hypothetical protein
LATTVHLALAANPDISVRIADNQNRDDIQEAMGARMRNVIDDPRGTLELGDIQASVFLVDIGAVPPGTGGTIWIDNLRVY